MRVVRTTRGQVCLQVARVRGAQLGALGIDGEFHNDGRFHPINANSLPADVFHGHAFDTYLGNANTTCVLAREAAVASHLGIDRGAGPNPHHLKRPIRNLRDLYFGLLGPNAVSVTYKAGDRLLSIPVLPGLGAYLIVGRTHPHQQVESGDTALGTEGYLGPMPPLAAINYRLRGSVCERVRNDPFSPPPRLGDPCPALPRSSRCGAPRHRDLHQQLHIHVSVHRHAVTGVRLTFVAPFAVTSARQHYMVTIPTGPCPTRPGVLASSGEILETIARNVNRGATVTVGLPVGWLFSYDCSRHLTMRRSAAIVNVYYEPSPHKRLLVGSTTVRRPANPPKAP
jgi:hypothetical protein